VWCVPGTIAGMLVEAGQVGEEQAARWQWVGRGVGGIWGSREGYAGGFAHFLWAGLVGAEWLSLFAVSW